MVKRADRGPNRMGRMIAVEALRAGGPDVLRVATDVAVPELRKGAVRVKVLAASVNPIDTRRRTGYGRRLLSLMGAAQFPLVLGNDFAGVVEAVGTGVQGWTPGQRVYGCKGASRFGTHAQYTIVPAGQLLAIPGGLRDDEAASLPYAFVTAYRLLTDGLKTRPDAFRGKSVLVHGGAGAVGSMAVRMLRQWGAKVTISGRHADQQCADALDAQGTLELATAGARRDGARFDAIVNCASFDDEPALVPLLGRDALGLATIVHPLISMLDARGWLGGAVAARRIWKARANAVVRHRREAVSLGHVPACTGGAGRARSARARRRRDRAHWRRLSARTGGRRPPSRGAGQRIGKDRSEHPAPVELEERPI